MQRDGFGRSRVGRVATISNTEALPENLTWSDSYRFCVYLSTLLCLLRFLGLPFNEYTPLLTFFDENNNTPVMCWLWVPVYHECGCRGKKLLNDCRDQNCGHRRVGRRPEKGGPYIQEETQTGYCPMHPPAPRVWPFGVEPLPPDNRR